MNPIDKIIPAILPKSVEEAAEKIAALPVEAKIFHYDVLEEDIWSEPGRDFEAHLMVKDPEAIAWVWADRGAKRLIVHSLGEWSDKLRGKVEIGLGVEMHVPLEEVFALAPQADFIQLMSIVEIGAQGHPLDERIFDRIKAVREKFPEVTISVDGGINTSNYRALLDAGADRLVVGSAFKELWAEIKK